MSDSMMLFDGPGPFTLPLADRIGLKGTTDGKAIAVVAEVQLPDRPTPVSIHIPMATDEAMRLLVMLNAARVKLGLEVPTAPPVGGTLQ